MSSPDDSSDTARLAVEACLDMADHSMALGEYAAAGELLSDALSRAVTELGEDDPDTASVWNSIGVWHRYRGEIDQAAEAYERAGRILEGVGADDDLATVLHNRASLAHLAGDLSSAASLVNRAIGLRADPGDTIDDLGVLAVVLADRDDFDAAHAVYERARSLLTERRGPDDAALVHLAANEAVLWYRRGNLAEAERRYLDAVAASERVLGPDHPHTGEVLANLAVLHESAGDLAAAHLTAARAVSILEPLVDPSHPSLGVARDVYDETRPSTVAPTE